MASPTLRVLGAALAILPTVAQAATPIAQDAGPAVLSDAPPRPGRGVAIFSFAGQSQPRLLARAMQLAGSTDLPGPKFDEFLAPRSATVRFLATDFGLEVQIEAEGARLAEVIAAAGAVLAAPGWTDETAFHAAVGEAIADGDPLEVFDALLAQLVDGGSRARHAAQLEPAASGGDGPDAEGADAPSAEPTEPDGPDDAPTEDGEGGGFPFALPPVVPPSLEQLEQQRGALLLGPRSALVAVKNDSAARTAAAAVLMALPPGDLPPPTAPAAAVAPERTYLAVIDQLPGAVVGWTAPLTAAAGPLATAGWSAFELGPLAAALEPYLLPGTMATARTTEAGQGVRSIQLRALVRTAAAEAALAAMDAAVAGIDDWSVDERAAAAALDRLFADGAAPLAPRESRYSVRARRALFGVEGTIGARSDLEGRVDELATAARASVDRRAARTLIAADEDTAATLAGTSALAPTWRLDRTAWDQARPEAVERAEQVLAAVGGAERWGALRTIQFHSETRAGDGNSRAPVRNSVQWRDLVEPRFLLTELTGGPTVTTAVNAGRVVQKIDGAKSREFGPDFAGRMVDMHRRTLIVILHELALRADLAPVLTEDGRLQLVDIEGTRTTYALTPESRPASSEAATGKSDYFEWTEVEGLWLPLRQRSAQPPATHRWSEVVLDPPVPDELTLLE